MNTSIQRHRFVFLFVMLAVAVLPLTARAQAPSPELTGRGVGPINTMCPVMPDEPIDSSFTIDYQGQAIGLCCRKCRTRFRQNPEKYLAQLPMLQTVSLTKTPRPSHDDEIDHSERSESTQSQAHDESQDHDDDEPHDHDDDHDEGDTGFSKLIAWLGKFHPPATHLPIGMLIGAALAEALFILTKRDLFRHAGAFCVVIAGFSALAAVILGWFIGGFTLIDDDWIQTVHRWLGTGTALLTLISMGLLIPASKADAKRFAYRVSLFAAAGLVGATGFFGGALVYGLDHYVW